MMISMTSVLENSGRYFLVARVASVVSHIGQLVARGSQGRSESFVLTLRLQVARGDRGSISKPNGMASRGASFRLHRRMHLRRKVLELFPLLLPDLVKQFLA